MSSIVHTSAPGKIILLGEHSVVYNREALCGVVDSVRIDCRINKISTSEIVVNIVHPEDGHIESIHLNSLFTPTTTIDENSRKCDVSGIYNDIIVPHLIDNIDCQILSKSIVVLVVFYYLTISKYIHSPDGVSIMVENKGIPEEKGLGGSAALCTSIAASFLALFPFHHFPTDSSSFVQLVNEWSYRGEVLFHGSPSGVDNTVSCYGGVVRFCKKTQGGCSIVPVRTDPFPILLIDSMMPKNTAKMIVKVRSLYDRLPRATDCLFDSIHQLVNSVVTEDGVLQHDMMCDAMEVNQGILNTLGVSCEAIDTIVMIARKHHYAAKLTGGGGGGCVIAIGRYDASDQDYIELINALSAYGYKTKTISIGGQGLKVNYIKYNSYL